MRFFDTRRFIDQSRAPLMDLYEARAGKPLNEITKADLELPEVLRAVLECRTWHLPPLFEISPSVRQAVRAVQEAELFDEIQSVGGTPKCTSCGKRRPVYGDRRALCLPCWDLLLREKWDSTPRPLAAVAGSAHAATVLEKIDEPALSPSSDRLYTVSSFQTFVTWAHGLLRLIPVNPDGAASFCWTPPKKAFLAMEVGCQECGTRHPSNGVWLWSEDVSEWGPGLCPLHRGTKTYPHHFIWGMHPADYMAWQQSYADNRKLHRTAHRYGLLSLLLVSADYEWVRLLSKLLPTTPMPCKVPVDPLVSIRAVGSVVRKVRTLEEVLGDYTK